MTVTILDVENTITTKDNKKHLDPFERTNSLVMVGVYPLDAKDPSTYIFDHCDITKDDDVVSNRNKLQGILNETTTLVGHNISHDLLWLWESGFVYTGRVYDTMLSDYIFNRGVSQPLDLGTVARRYDCAVEKQDTLKEYFKKGYSTRDIPRKELDYYLRCDLACTKELYQKMQIRLESNQDAGLRNVIDITNEVSVVLARMYQSGFKIDMDKLDDVEKEFRKEKLELETSLQEFTKKLMGDTPINLGSTEQLSWVLFSRKPLDKNAWHSCVEPHTPTNVFKGLIRKHFKTLFKTKAKQCGRCKGRGQFYKTKKDGNPFKKPTKCNVCGGSGFVYEETNQVAGLKFNPPSAKWASASGFSTSKGNLEILERFANSRDMTEASEFLSKLRRLSAITSYLSNFVEGIKDFVKEDGFLHVRLNQHVTATGRFSGANPNMQNMPRGSTFPVKKVFVSRFQGGKILEADFAQLEFRVAAYLSQDPVAIKEVTEGFDVHSYTAKVISDAGQPTSRQVAKAHTFAPLYGATGYGRTEAEATYYKHFIEKYKGIGKWHKKLANQAVGHGFIRIPSGREFAFPDTQRRRDGTVTNFTQIKNYPVQSFATADIVPVVLVELYNKLDGHRSCVVNSVHDSIVVDVHPDEEQQVIDIIEDVQKNLVAVIKARYGIEVNVPLLLEGKIGNDWLNQTEL